MRSDPAQATQPCWTCKARKVQCDRTLPACRRCIKAHRDCEGYEIRLTWPREKGKKRATNIASSSTKIFFLQKGTKLRFIHTSSTDIQLHRRLLTHGGVQLPRQIHPYQRLWRKAPSGLKDAALVHYFHEVAYGSLVTFGENKQCVRDVIMRMALARDSVPGMGLKYALLAVSSLHRSGALQEEAVQLKVLALRALSASARRDTLSHAEAVQHVAACMLLSDFEIILPSESSGDWIWYIRGALDIIRGTRLESQYHHGDVNTILDWVHYHDTMSRFVTRHWHHSSVAVPGAELPRGPDQEQERILKPMLGLQSQNPTHAILNLLSETLDTLLDPTDPRSATKVYKNHIEALEAKVSGVLYDQDPEDADMLNMSPEKVYQLVTLMYLLRASGMEYGASERLDRLLDVSLKISAKSSSCNHFFPLFILACEARTDQQRTIILDILDRSEVESNVHRMEGLREMIRSIWVQRDLYADGDLLVDYLGLMSSVISSNMTLPSLV